ncbi:hypothetical protein BBJ29_002978 [Phytophthora kernoviae]|uniref:Uncharacterized protein n=1 Tax=Phytophthora kernoviae TaxID=325452 RepID=A0A3F2RPK0_9STRA|nr:hypothetical protein BBJ29_002978 [Phytophthora kernoviae]RLN61671.1 hypothetical protein BBP00_00005251 [Phytophthora kernoviae]
MSNDIDVAVMLEFLDEFEFDDSLDASLSTTFERLELSYSSDETAVESTRSTKNCVMSTFARERQNGYHKKSAAKKKANRLAICNAFVAGLEWLVAMMEGRVQSSERVIRRRQESTFLAADTDVLKQLELNRSIVNCAETWIETWEQRRAENKFFMRAWGDQINNFMERLKGLCQDVWNVNVLLAVYAEE